MAIPAGGFSQVPSSGRVALATGGGGAAAPTLLGSSVAHLCWSGHRSLTFLPGTVQVGRNQPGGAQALTHSPLRMEEFSMLVPCFPWARCLQAAPQCTSRCATCCERSSRMNSAVCCLRATVPSVAERQPQGLGTGMLLSCLLWHKQRRLWEQDCWPVRRGCTSLDPKMGEGAQPMGLCLCLKDLVTWVPGAQQAVTRSLPFFFFF